jgi:hypothetical protein
MKKILNIIGITLFTILLSVSLTGCGLTKAQKSSIASFGQATATLGAISKEQFQGGRENVIQMNRQRLAIEKKILPARKLDGTSVDRSFYANCLNLDSGIDPTNIERRVDAVELLTEYGNLLVAFSTETQEKELNTTSSKFTDSLKAFPNNPLSAEEINGLGQVVVVAGKMWVEREKKDALKKIIPTVSPMITKICDIIENDFDLNKKGVAAAIFNTQDRLANEAIDGLKREGGSIGDRLLLIDGFSFADQNKEKIETVSSTMLKAVGSLRKANKELTSLIENENISIEDIKAFADDAKILAGAIKSFMK